MHRALKQTRWKTSAKLNYRYSLPLKFSFKSLIAESRANIRNAVVQHVIYMPVLDSANDHVKLNCKGDDYRCYLHCIFTTSLTVCAYSTHCTCARLNESARSLYRALILEFVTNNNSYENFHITFFSYNKILHFEVRKKCIPDKK